MGNIRASDTQAFRQGDVRHCLHRVSHTAAYKRITEHRVLKAQHAVHHNRIAAFLKIQVPADIVHQDEAAGDDGVQMGNRFMKAQGVETAFFRIRDDSFAVLEGAGNRGLAMALEHRHVNHIVNGSSLVAELDLHSGSVILLPGILLQVLKGNIVMAAYPVISGCPERLSRTVAYPGTFHHSDILESVLLKVFNDPGQEFAVGGGSAGRGLGRDQVGL